MDLEPINPSKDAPKTEEYGITWGRYNWSGWKYMGDILPKWGVNISSFAGSNDGDEIPESVCLDIANAIEQHLNELSPKDKEWLEPHIQLWRTCGGYRQF